MPIDNGVTTKHEAHRFQIGKRKFLGWLQAIDHVLRFYRFREQTSILFRWGATTNAMNAVANRLEAVREDCDNDARRAVDPVGFVHRYSDVKTQELVGLLASSMAFGNVATIRKKVDEALWRLKPHQGGSLEDLESALRGWKHRLFVGSDVARLWWGAKKLQSRHGTLGARFAAGLRAYGLSEYASRNGAPASLVLDDDRALRLKATIEDFATELRSLGGLAIGGKRRGPTHLLPTPDGSGACKRFLLYLRWMVRARDGVDLELWDVHPAALMVPVDTHLLKLSRNLGWTKRTTADFRTSVEITRALSTFDPQDPVKYDFALCHLGMLQGCPSKKHEVKCGGCGVQPLCVHWKKRSPRKEANALLSQSGLLRARS